MQQILNLKYKFGMPFWGSGDMEAELGGGGALEAPPGPFSDKKLRKLILDLKVINY